MSRETLETRSLSFLVLAGESCGNTLVTSKAVVLTVWSSDPWGPQDLPEPVKSVIFITLPKHSAVFTLTLS